MAQSPPSHSHGDPPRTALLACLGHPGPHARASIGRAARLRGPQETLARPAPVMALRLTMLVPLLSIGELLRYPGQPGKRLSLVSENGNLRCVKAGLEEFPVIAG